MKQVLKNILTNIECKIPYLVNNEEILDLPQLFNQINELEQEEKQNAILETSMLINQSKFLGKKLLELLFESYRSTKEHFYYSIINKFIFLDQEEVEEFVSGMNLKLIMTIIQVILYQNETILLETGKEILKNLKKVFINKIQFAKKDYFWDDEIEKKHFDRDELVSFDRASQFQENQMMESEKSTSRYDYQPDIFSQISKTSLQQNNDPFQSLRLSDKKQLQLIMKDINNSNQLGTIFKIISIYNPAYLNLTIKLRRLLFSSGKLGYECAIIYQKDKCELLAMQTQDVSQQLCKEKCILKFLEKYAKIIYQHFLEQIFNQISVEDKTNLLETENHEFINSENYPQQQQQKQNNEELEKAKLIEKKNGNGDLKEIQNEDNNDNLDVNYDQNENKQQQISCETISAIICSKHDEQVNREYCEFQEPIDENNNLNKILFQSALQQQEKIKKQQQQNLLLKEEKKNQSEKQFKPILSDQNDNQSGVIDILNENDQKNAIHHEEKDQQIYNQNYQSVSTKEQDWIPVELSTDLNKEQLQRKQKRKKQIEEFRVCRDLSKNTFDENFAQFQQESNSIEYIKGDNNNFENQEKIQDEKELIQLSKSHNIKLSKRLIEITTHYRYDVIINDFLEGSQEIKSLYDDNTFNNHIMSLGYIIEQIFEQQLLISYDIIDQSKNGKQNYKGTIRIESIIKKGVIEQLLKSETEKNSIIELNIYLRFVGIKFIMTYYLKKNYGKHFRLFEVIFDLIDYLKVTQFQFRKELYYKDRKNEKVNEFIFSKKELLKAEKRKLKELRKQKKLIELEQKGIKQAHKIIDEDNKKQQQKDLNFSFSQHYQDEGFSPLVDEFKIKSLKKKKEQTTPLELIPKKKIKRNSEQSSLQENSTCMQIQKNIYEKQKSNEFLDRYNERQIKQFGFMGRPIDAQNHGFTLPGIMPEYQNYQEVSLQIIFMQRFAMKALENFLIK